MLMDARGPESIHETNVCLQEILPTVALAFLALPPAAMLPHSPKVGPSPDQQWQEYMMEAGTAPLMAPTLVNVPLSVRPPFLETIKEGNVTAEMDNEKQFRGLSLGGVLWTIRQGIKRAQLLTKDSEAVSVACMTSLMLALCIGSMYMTM